MLTTLHSRKERVKILTKNKSYTENFQILKQTPVNFYKTLLELKENSLTKEISFANFLIIVRAVSYAALTLLFPFFKMLTHVPVTH